MTDVLGKYSFGMGDRFGVEGSAQLRAVLKMKEHGTVVTPVWNKSHREHTTVKSDPRAVRQEADQAVSELGYSGRYCVDADHINLKILAPYIPVSNFFTIDVADYIGKEADQKEKAAFLHFVSDYTQGVEIPGISEKFEIGEKQLAQIINTFLFAAYKASEVYKTIRDKKQEAFTVEISMDEVESPQTPIELFFVLAALAFYRIPVRTIAPKFTGRFNKGIDYQGNLKDFEKEFEDDLLVISYAIQEFDLPNDLKLSIHSGSDKFSIYPIMNTLIKKHNAGLHVKTAGTTWLEEITVLAESGEEAFDFAVGVYKSALDRFDELTSPYPDVLNIDKSNLPKVNQLKAEGGKEMGSALRHEPGESKYNPDFRQLMHCAYKIAAERNEVFFPLLETYKDEVSRSVTDNLYRKHLKPIFSF